MKADVHSLTIKDMRKIHRLWASRFYHLQRQVIWLSHPHNLFDLRSATYRSKTAQQEAALFDRPLYLVERPNFRFQVRYFLSGNPRQWPHYNRCIDSNLPILPGGCELKQIFRNFDRNSRRTILIYTATGKSDYGKTSAN